MVGHYQRQDFGVYGYPCTDSRGLENGDILIQVNELYPAHLTDRETWVHGSCWLIAQTLVCENGRNPALQVYSSFYLQNRMPSSTHTNGNNANAFQASKPLVVA